jgi:hypothetical protein
MSEAFGTKPRGDVIPMNLGDAVLEIAVADILR